MDLSQNTTVKTLALLLLLAAISQPVYTALYILAPEVDRQILWGLEGLLFTVMAAFAGSALVMAKRYTLGFAAIAFSTVLNVVQVGVGLTQFGPFRAATEANPELGGVTFTVVAFSFFGYNAAKILLGLAAIVFGSAKMKAGGKVLGGLTVLVVLVAFVANAIVLMFTMIGTDIGRVAGGHGVAATVLLAFCLLSLRYED